MTSDLFIEGCNNGSFLLGFTCGTAFWGFVVWIIFGK